MAGDVNKAFAVWKPREVVEQRVSQRFESHFRSHHQGSECYALLSSSEEVAVMPFGFDVTGFWFFCIDSDCLNLRNCCTVN